MNAPVQSTEPVTPPRMRAWVVATLVLIAVGGWLQVTTPDPDQRICVVRHDERGRFWACYTAGDSTRPDGPVVYAGPESGIDAANAAWIKREGPER